MKRITYIVATIGEIEKLVAEFLGVSDSAGIFSDLNKLSPELVRGDYVHFEVKPEKNWIKENHDKFIGEVQNSKKIVWDWQLQAVLEELAKDGKIEFGEYLLKPDDQK